MKKLSDDVTRDLPEGTVTFLFTDIEGSTKLLRQLGDEYANVLADQRRILRAIFTKWHGREVDTQGDSFFVSFPRATEAAGAAVDAQLALADHAWPQGVAVRVRMGLHTGEPWTADEGYVGMDVHRAARIAHVGYGGQVLLSETTAALLREGLPDGVTLLDLGLHRLKDMAFPEHIRQLIISGLPSEFPPLKSLESLDSETIAEHPTRLPAFLLETTPDASWPVFVGRESELEQLDTALDNMLQSQGGVLFVAGNAGSGKTALMEAFSTQAQERVQNLLVARGGCSAFTGSGDPYSPFRALFRELTGDVETAWKAGTVSLEMARRLWSALPTTTEAIVKYGPDLIDTFVSGHSLLERVASAAPSDGGLIKRIMDLVERGRDSSQASEQRRLFEEVRDLLIELSHKWPLLLLLDDMQWSDSSSINLLFHLGRELAGSQILILCAYRPEETVPARDGSAHPLEPVLHELERSSGQIAIDLSQVDGEHFIDQFIDSEPNRLDDEFRRRMYLQSAGQALFTVELLRNLQEQGDLVKDDSGFWIKGSHLDWSTLPVRVEGVIKARIGRLEEELRELLSVAAVEGADFTAQVVARVQQIQERSLLRTLSRELDKHHQLVSEGEEVRVGSRLLSRYRFAHALFQRYLYNDLSAGERRVLHGEIAAVLEALYGDQLSEIAIQLGKHYTAAGESAKAIPFLIDSGDAARLSFAFKEAVAFYEQAVILLRESDNQELLGRVLMRLGLVYHNDYQFDRSRKVYDEAFAIGRRRRGVIRMPGSISQNYGEVYRRTIGTMPLSLDPSYFRDTASSLIVAQLFEGLVETTLEGAITPNLARSWDVLESGRRYIFYLREDALWSDGKPVTAYDFEFAWKRALTPSSLSYPAILLFDVIGAEDYYHGLASDPDQVGVRATDEHSLMVDLVDPVGYFLQILANPVCFPVPRHQVEIEGERWSEPSLIVGNGPFIIESWYHEGRIVLARNPLFHGRSSGNVGRVELAAEDTTDASNSYELDELDHIGVNHISLEKRRRFAQQFPEEYVSYPSADTTFLAFNLTSPSVSDSRVRQALALATDKLRLVSITGDRFLPATGGLVPPNLPGHVQDIGAVFDPQGARRLLAESGFSSGKGVPEISLLVNRTKVRQIIVADVLSCWADTLGIKGNLRSMPFPDYIKALDIRDYDVVFNTWSADYPDPDSFLRSIDIGRYGGWKNERYLELVNQARVTQDQGYRLELYRQAELILAEDVPIIPILHLRTRFMLKPWIKNVPTRDVVELFKHVIVEPH